MIVVTVLTGNTSTASSTVESVGADGTPPFRAVAIGPLRSPWRPPKIASLCTLQADRERIGGRELTATVVALVSVDHGLIIA